MNLQNKTATHNSRFAKAVLIQNKIKNLDNYG